MREFQANTSCLLLHTPHYVLFQLSSLAKFSCDASVHTYVTLGPCCCFARQPAPQLYDHRAFLPCRFLRLLLLTQRRAGGVGDCRSGADRPRAPVSVLQRLAERRCGLQVRSIRGQCWQQVSFGGFEVSPLVTPLDPFAASLKRYDASTHG